MIRRLTWVTVVVAVLAACTKTTGEQVPDGEPGSPTGPSGSAAAGSTGPIEVQGSLVTSGAYDATWTWEPGNYVVTGPLGGITLTSDKDTFASITVANDGTFAFGSGEVPEIGLSVAGSGAEVTLDSQNLVVCIFTVDADLAVASGPLHLAGTMTIVGSDGVITC